MALPQRGGVWGLDVGGRGRLGTVWPASVLSLILISMRLIIPVFIPIISVLGRVESSETVLSLLNPKKEWIVKRIRQEQKEQRRPRNPIYWLPFSVSPQKCDIRAFLNLSVLSKISRILCCPSQ